MYILKTMIADMRQHKTKEQAAQHLGYSTRRISQLCNEYFGNCYKSVQALLICSDVCYLSVNCKQKEIAKILFNGNVHCLSKYFSKNMGYTLGSIKEREIRIMVQKTIEKARVIEMLVNSDSNLTIMKLNVSYETIAELRAMGYPIISVPGPRGGYNLGKTSKENCIAWVNRIRKNRFGLETDFII